MRASALLCFAGLSLIASVAPTRARASGFDAPHIGSAQSGPANADAAAVWWNPAQLGYLRQTELNLGAGVIVGAISYQRELLGQYQYSDNLAFKNPIAPEDIDPSKTGTLGKVRDVPVGPVMDAFVAIPAVRDRLVVGLGVGIPYVAVLGFPERGPQRFAAQSLLFVTPHASLALGAKLHEMFSIGAGISYVLGVMSLNKVQDFAALDTFGQSLARPPIGQNNDFGSQAPSNVRELDVLARPVSLTKMVAHGVSFHAGIAVRPTQKLDLGLVYHHGATLRFRGQFRLDMDDDFFTQDLAAQGLQYPAVVRGKAQVTLRIPKRVTLAAGYQFTPRFRLDGFVSYVRYREFDRIGIRFTSDDLAQERLGVGRTVDQDIVRNWNDTAHVELNARVRVGKKSLVSGTGGYSSPASPVSTIDLLSPDGHRIILGAGFSHSVNDRFAIMADLKAQVMAPRRVTGSDYDLGNGTYRLFLGLASLHGRFLFMPPGSRKGSGAAKKANPAQPSVPPPPPPGAFERFGRPGASHGAPTDAGASTDESL